MSAAKKIEASSFEIPANHPWASAWKIFAGVAVAGLAMIDMVKALDPAAVITDVQVEEKLGGKTGEWHRPVAEAAT